MEGVLGIDIGTTHTKLVFADLSGKLIWDSKTSYGFTEPAPGYHEQDPGEIMSAVQTLLDKALAELATKHEIRAVCFSAAMHGVIAVDEQGEALGPLITWADIRSNPIAIRLKESGRAAALQAATGTPVHPMSPLCKIAWLREEQPELFERAARFISIKEYIWFRLTGHFEIDHSIASATGLFDIRKRDWLPEALAFAGIGAERLSKPVETGFSRLANGLRLVIGGSDGALSNPGAGAVGAGEAAMTIGTSGAFRLLSRRPVEDPRNRLFNYILDDRYYITGGALNNGGITLDWFVKQFYGEIPASGLNDLIAEAGNLEPAAEGLIFLPYVYGERAPVWDAAAQGVFFGIRPVHTRAHFLRAVLEGISFAIRQIMEALEENLDKIDLVHASGGFTASPVWLQIMADILGKPLGLSQQADASAMGAVYAGLKYLDVIGEWKDISGLQEKTPVIQPNKETAVLYQRNYRVYSGLYDKLKEDFYS